MLVACQADSADGHVETVTADLTDNNAARMLALNTADTGGGTDGGGGLDGGGCGDGGVVV